MVVPDKYIKRVTSTIPFGYELSEIKGYLQPVEDQIDNLTLVVSMIKNKEASLQEGCDWLEYKTGRSLTKAGLKKHIDTKHGKSDIRLGDEPASLLAR